MKKIICWGDSITHGMGMTIDKKYPSVLQSFLGDGYSVLNCGSSGEKSYVIAARQGAYKVFLSKEIVFKPDVSTVLIGNGTDDCFKVEDGRSMTIFLQNAIATCDLSIKTTFINGAEYTLSYEHLEDDSERLYMSRSNKGEALIIPADTEVLFDSVIKQQDKENYCEIFYFGANDGFALTDEGRAAYVKCYKDMIERHGDDCYLIILPTWTHLFDEALVGAFGDKTVNLRSGKDILRVMDVMNITPKEDDWIDINQDLIPKSLSWNNNRHDVHLNEYGYYYMATMVYEKGVKLGYWK